MKRLFLTLALALSALVTATPASSAGAETTHFSFKGAVAEAAFSSVDPSGCVVTDLFLFGLDGRRREGGDLVRESMAGMSIRKVDVCTDTQLVIAGGSSPVPAPAFQIDSRLRAATLNATLEVFDFVSLTSFPVEVSVSWTGTGAIRREKQHFQVKRPGLKANFRFDGLTRDATASGTVSDGTTNFTPEPAVFADMYSVKTGEVVIRH
jgi:hypothetical protein